MCRPQCLLALFALSVGVAQSWDIAIITGDQLEFYTNKTKTSNVQTQLHTDMTVLAYDAVHNMLLFVDKRNDNASIFSYHLATKKYQPLVRKIAFENIHSLAFDPVNSMLFWTDTRKKSIFSMSLKNGTKNSAYGNLWLKMVDETPAGIAVDSCRGYVYWTNTVTKPTIERARFDGTDRKILVNTEIHMPVSLAIDQHTKRLYWADDEEGIHFSIKSSDLEGNDIKNLYKGFHHEPTVLTVSNDSVYWVDRAWSKVWKLPKSAEGNVDPEEYAAFNITPYGIAANYLIQDQIKGVSECKGLNDLLQNSSAINDSFNVPPVVGLFCVNGDMVNNKEECKCKSGYTGIRCNISVCQNFCFQGRCIITKDGQPSCRCEDGFLGDRCEVHVCNQFCLNNGVCSLNQEHKPVCSCATDFEGTRCEAEKVIKTTVDPAIVVTAETGTVKTSSAAMPCNCSSNVTKSSMYSSELLGATDGEFVLPTSCNDGWDPIRDPIIMVLGIICGLLVLASVVLFTKILQLKKRPRIKKRIIINKNVTPLTARPDQCEITIENCCNMNICETPCFEPRSTIRPTLLDSKPGKEEKKNLIANMEYPDDY